MSTLLREGINVGDVWVTLRLAFGVCDAPTRAFILQVKSPTGYRGCDTCVQHGMCYDKRVTYPDLKSKTSDECSFREKRLQTAHWYQSILGQWLPPSQ